MISGGLFSEIRLDYYKILGLQTYDTFNKHAEQRWPVITARVFDDGLRVLLQSILCRRRPDRIAALPDIDISFLDIFVQIKCRDVTYWPFRSPFHKSNAAAACQHIALPVA